MVGVFDGLGFCVRSKFVRYNVALRHYMSILVNTGIMERL